MKVADLYRKFRGSAPRRFSGVRIELPKEIAVIGNVTAIEYDTKIDGKIEKFRHTFLPGSRPTFAVGARRGQLYLLGDRFVFTERGIVDLDAKGRQRE